MKGNSLAKPIAVIPARGGSKRIPRKNIRLLMGQPLIAHTIEAALRSEVFDRVIVSTDDEEIAALARSAGAEVPFLRERSLADDHTPSSLVTVDALQRLDPSGNRHAEVAQLMANCPFRDAEDIRSSHAQFRAGSAPTQLSVMRFAWFNPWWAMRRGAGMQLEPLFPQEIKARSQDLPELFCPTGAIWWARATTLREAKTFYAAGHSGWEIAPLHGLDIDTEADWEFAEACWGSIQKESRRSLEPFSRD